jgi:hypothetical protein
MQVGDKSSREFCHHEQDKHEENMFMETHRRRVVTACAVAPAGCQHTSATMSDLGAHHSAAPRWAAPAGPRVRQWHAEQAHQPIVLEGGLWALVRGCSAGRSFPPSPTRLPPISSLLPPGFFICIPGNFGKTPVFTDQHRPAGRNFRATPRCSQALPHQK